MIDIRYRFEGYTAWMGKNREWMAVASKFLEPINTKHTVNVPLKCEKVQKVSRNSKAYKKLLLELNRAAR